MKILCRHILPLAMVLISTLGMDNVLKAQTSYHYNNEWYRFNQNYFKLLVARDGPCRVYRADLVTAGVPNLATLDPDHLQVIYRGKEISIRVKTTSGGDLDFFEFEGRRNDGGVDSLMYRDPIGTFGFDPEQQPNRFSSFFTDTSAYFVTWDSSALLRRNVVTLTNFGGRIPQSTYRYKVLEEHKGAYYEGGGGSTDANHVLNPDYITGEGWVGFPFETGDFQDIVARSVKTPGFVPGGQPTHMECRAFGVNSSDQHVLKASINGIEVFRDTTVGIQISTRSFDTQVNLTPTLVVRFEALGVGLRTDKQRMAWFTLEYNRNFDLDDSARTVIQNWQSTDTTLLRFVRADVNNEAWIWDPVSNLHINGVVSGDTLRFLVPGHTQTRKLYVYTDKALRRPEILPQTKLTNLSDIQAGAEFIIITDQAFANSANRYATYRDTCSVNRLSSKVVYVNQIMDEFGYGSMTTMAIKNFVKYALDNWVTKPKFVLLWGKGRTNPRLGALYPNSPYFNFVPSFGMPANDYEYVSNFDRDTVNLVPEIPIGRVSFYEDQQGLNYLAKVDEYEHQAYAPWLKTAVFLGGGKNQGEQNSISQAINTRFVPPFLDAPVGGEARTYLNSNTGITANTTMASHTAIDEGAAIIQFFGHSSTNIFDVDILEPNRYLNFHKYPFMIAFGCYGGDFVQAQQSFGERFVLEPNRGSIAYLANSTEGFLGALRDYGLALHNTLNGSQYGQPLGHVIRETIRQYFSLSNGTTNVLTANHCKQMNLQGDPSIVLRLPQKPDLAISEPKIWFTPEVLNAEDPFFDMNIVVANEGRSYDDTVVVRIVQRLPSGLPIAHPDTLILPVRLAETLTVRLPNIAGRAMAGTNTFTVSVDALDSLDEYYEPNNIVDKMVIVQGSTPALIYPYEFAIVGKDSLTLVASSYLVDRRSQMRYSFEIDTAYSFNSAWKKQSGPITGSSVEGQWQLPFLLSPSQVYYWRVRFTDTYPALWSVGSFKYIPTKEGWSQSKPPQFFDDLTEALVLDKISREWNFEPFTEQLHCLIHSFGTQEQNGRPDYFFGGYGSNSAPPFGIVYTPIDQHSLKPTVQNTNFGDWKFLAAPSATDPNTVLDLINVIATMPEGDYFLMATSDEANFPAWRPEYLAVLSQIGVVPSDFANLRPEDRAIVFGRKGSAPGTATVIIRPNMPISGHPARQDLLINVSSSGSSGKLISPWIGPAKQWSNLQFHWESVPGMGADSVEVDVFGQNSADQISPLRQNLEEGSYNLSGIDAQTYPRLRMDARMQDMDRHSAPKFEDWEIYYQPVADLSIDPVLHFNIPDTITEGQIVYFGLGLRNLTGIVSDSVQVRYTLQRQDRTQIVIGEQKIAPMGVRTSALLDYRFHSAGKGLQEGLASLIIDINPDQPFVEQNLFNNRFVTNIYVKTDKIGPVLDVTVDGKHLMEGDIVQPNPEISIMVNDENPFLPVAISDTTYSIWFGTERTYQFNQQLQIATDNRIQATAGRLPENKAKLVFSPGRLEDGEYTLAVQSHDFKGNASGKAEYVIHFNVESDKAISEVIPYPNPFSSSTRFAYTLTGDEKPYVFQLHIYTMTGRLVKVVDLLDLGEVYFGRNMTEYAWDGRDEFGDLLANGVYLYKTVVKFKDRYGVKEMETGLEGFFKNGFGKMYILR